LLNVEIHPHNKENETTPTVFQIARNISETQRISWKMHEVDFTILATQTYSKHTIYKVEQAVHTLKQSRMKERERKREKCKSSPGDRDWLVFVWFTRNKYVNNNNSMILALFTGRFYFFSHCKKRGFGSDFWFSFLCVIGNLALL
jgi:hypothetical protein